MKKIYLSIFASAFALSMNAQLSLTKAFNEPAVGNVNVQQGFDSTTVLPKNTGASQTWNFSSIVQNTVTETTTYTTAASTPSASLFPSANLAEDDGSGQYTYSETTATNFQLWGFADNAGSGVTFTNSAIAAVWPVTMGYSNTDVFAGTATITLPGTVNGTISTNGTGTGDLILPGSVTFSNCLQVKMNNTMKLVLGSFPISFSVDVVSTDYSYYHSTQKFPILTLNYETQTISTGSTPTVTSSYNIRVNNAVLTGINDVNLDAINYNVYPNPATDNVNISLSNETLGNVSVTVVNNIGQVVKSLDLGNSIEIKHKLNTSGLPKGMYHITTNIGNKSSTKKLIIQ